MKNQIILVLALLLTGCEKEDSVTYDKKVIACGVQNPIENLPWLADQFKDMSNYPQMNGIVLYEYQGKQLIDIYKSYFSSIYGRQYWCDGTQVIFNNNEEFKHYLDNRKQVVILFGQQFKL